MADETKTREQLIEELRALRLRNAELEAREQGQLPAEQTRSQSQELFARIFRETPVALTITRARDGQIVDCNDECLRLLGYSRREIIGRTSSELRLWVDPQTRERVGRAISRAGTVRDVDLQFRTKAGALRYSRTSLTLLDIEGEPCVLTIVVDVTEQRRVEQRQRFLIEASAALATTVEYETALTDFAQLAVRYFADWCAIDLRDGDDGIRRQVVEAADVVDRELWDAIAGQFPIDADDSAAAELALPSLNPEFATDVGSKMLAGHAHGTRDLRQLYSLGIQAYYVIPLVVRDRLLGKLAFVSVSPERQHGPDDLALATELGRRVGLALENALLYREARQALEARDSFLSVAAHELKTPVTLMLARSELLLRRAQRTGTSSQQENNYVRSFHDQAARLNRLIELLLEVSRLQIGQLILDRRSLDLATVVRRVVDELAQTEPQHVLRCEIAPGSLPIEGDELRLEQVFHNLLQNAVKYSSPGSTVEVLVRRAGAEVAVAISDQGVGIPSSALPNIFSRFFRAPNVDSATAGMGVGLYVVKEIVTLHGGTVEVVSSEGQGSTFTIRLPLTDE